MPSEQRFVTLYFGDDVNIGKLVYSMLQQEPGRRPEMEQVLVQMVEIKVEQKFKSMTIRQESLQQERDAMTAENENLQDQTESLRDELDIVKSQNNDLQIKVEQWRKSASQVVRLFFLYNALTGTNLTVNLNLNFILIQVHDVRPKVTSPVKAKFRVQPQVTYGNYCLWFPTKEKNELEKTFKEKIVAVSFISKLCYTKYFYNTFIPLIEIIQA